MFASLTKAYSPNENLIKFFFLLSIFLFHARVKHKNGKKKKQKILFHQYIYTFSCRGACLAWAAIK
jgi:hypothetical protein